MPHFMARAIDVDHHLVNITLCNGDCYSQLRNFYAAGK
jgi:hypothetical protein